MKYGLPSVTVKWPRWKDDEEDIRASCSYFSQNAWTVWRSLTDPKYCMSLLALEFMVKG